MPLAAISTPEQLFRGQRFSAALCCPVYLVQVVVLNLLEPRQNRLHLAVDFELDPPRLAEELRNRAKDALLTQALASEEQMGSAVPADDLLNMEGMNAELANILAARGVISMEDLAEQSVDELLEIDGMDESRAGVLIMKAREPWFADTQADRQENTNQ